jgi:hypothetical protein
LPARRVVIQLEFTDIRRLRRWWLVVDRDGDDLCIDDPGHEIDITICTDLLTMTQVYVGDTTFRTGMSSGRIKVHGPLALTRTLPQWFARSKFADTKPAGSRQDASPPAL